MIVLRRVVHRRGQTATIGLFATLLLAAACSSSGSNGRRAERPTPMSSTTTPRPAGPAADLSPLTGGKGVFIGSALTYDLAGHGYVQREYAAAGTAASYKAAGELAEDGEWTFQPDASAPYRTRVLVRAPKDAKRFSGNVVVEWLNVSGGVDADPEWSSLHEEIMRNGDIWVGVSAQRIGVMGGPVLVGVNVPGAEAAGKGLVKIDPARYGTLSHPGDGFAFDIFTQVARALRAGSGLDGAEPEHLIAAGESQSAYAMVTYYDGVQPLTRAFDGFFVHSRGAGYLPIVGADQAADIASAIGRKPARFRDDLDAPVLDLQSESDITGILNSYAARQPDSAKFRLWEVAGTAHADQHLLGATASYVKCGVPINNGPFHLVAKAALRALTTWITDGKTPPDTARRLEVAGNPPAVQRDSLGIALGGIRTPPVDVPVAALSGQPGPNPSTICLLLGSTNPIPAAELAKRYPSRDAYLQDYRTDADKVIAAGYVLPQDRSALLAYADPSLVQG
ncbi:MAG TPA: alpha/beta hydrolase domain-containing protein [Acidimicrobiales bacterium]|jgi:hypothetical protein|nr:alpha/beta hydrolase domain-containing protein [Acidimicrobiales bacterium]